MELNEFVKETILQISKGIIDAQGELKDSNSNILINPSKMEVNLNGDKVLRNDGDVFVQELDIKVAVSESKKEGGKASIGVVAGIFGAGSQISSDDANQVVSTISFKIPIVFPLTEIPKNSKNSFNTF